MAIDPKKLNPAGGDTIVLLQDLNGFKAGAELVTRKVMDLKGNFVVMAADADPNARAFAIKDMAAIGLPGEGGGEDETETDLEGPVYDYFATHLPLTEDVVQEFLADYISTQGTDDLDMLETALAMNDLDVGTDLDLKQTAQLYITTMELIGGDEPESAKAILEAPAEDKKAAAKAKGEAAKKAAADKKAAEKAKADKPAATEKPATKATKDTATVDKSSWTPLKMDALTLAGAMMPLFAQSPDNFDEVVAFAVKQVKAAAEVANPRSK